ncbi:hypothetical protein Tco_1449744 [Tanacetum coccineum]
MVIIVLPQIPIVSKPEPCNNQTVNEFPQTLPSVQPTSCTEGENSFTYDSKPNFVDDSPNLYKRRKKKANEDKIKRQKDRYWKIPICYDDDDDYTIAITPVLPTKEPINSLSIEDEHLDTIPATESDEVIKV